MFFTLNTTIQINSYSFIPNHIFPATSCLVSFTQRSIFHLLFQSYFLLFNTADVMTHWNAAHELRSSSVSCISGPSAHSLQKRLLMHDWVHFLALVWRNFELKGDLPEGTGGWGSAPASNWWCSRFNINATSKGLQVHFWDLKNTAIDMLILIKKIPFAKQLLAYLNEKRSLSGDESLTAEQPLIMRTGPAPPAPLYNFPALSGTCSNGICFLTCSSCIMTGGLRVISSIWP